MRAEGVSGAARGTWGEGGSFSALLHRWTERMIAKWLCGVSSLQGTVYCTRCTPGSSGGCRAWLGLRCEFVQRRNLMQYASQ